MANLQNRLSRVVGPWTEMYGGVVRQVEQEEGTCSRNNWLWWRVQAPLFPWWQNPQHSAGLEATWNRDDTAQPLVQLGVGLQWSVSQLSGNENAVCNFLEMCAWLVWLGVAGALSSAFLFPADCILTRHSSETSPLDTWGGKLRVGEQQDPRSLRPCPHTVPHCYPPEVVAPDFIAVCPAAALLWGFSPE